MKTVVHIIYGHSAFDDRIFFKEACSLVGEYRTVILSKTKNGNLYDMGERKREAGVYSGVEIYGFSDRELKGVLKKINNKWRRIFKRPKTISHRSLFEKIDQLGMIPDLIHIHEPELLSASKKLKKKYSSKIVFDCHEYHYAYFQTSDFSDNKYLHETGERALNLKKALKYCDYIISVTTTMEAINWFLNPSIPHITVYNSSLINKAGKTIPSKPIRLVHEGVMSFDRGFKLMLEMFENKWFQENVRLKIIGGIPKIEQIYLDDKIAANPALKECLEVVGWVPYESLSDYISGDIGIIFLEKYPNYYLSMPNKLFNYIGASLPILSVKCLEIERVLDDFKCGVSCERSVQSIKDALEILVDNYDYYQDGVTKAKSSFSWNRDALKLQSCYHTLLGNSAEIGETDDSSATIP